MREMITPEGSSPPERAPTEKYAGVVENGQSRVLGPGHLGQHRRGGGVLRDPLCIELVRCQVPQVVQRDELRGHFLEREGVEKSGLARRLSTKSDPQTRKRASDERPTK